MTKFIPREKMSKKARKELDLSRRETWAVPPATRKIESKKHYNRKTDKACIRFEHDGAGFLLGKNQAGIV